MEEVKVPKTSKASAGAKVRVRKESAAWPLVVGQLFGGPSTPAPRTYKDYAEYYGKLVWAYSCVFAITSAGASLPLKLYKRKSRGRREPVEDHPVLDLLDRPNPAMTYFDLMEATLGYMELSGIEYWEIARKKIGGKETDIPGELYPLRPDRIEIMPDTKGKGVREYRFRVQPGSKFVAFDPADIVQFKYFCPRDDWYGQGSFVAASSVLALDDEAIQYNKDFFANSACPAGTIETDRNVSPENAERIEAKLRQRTGRGGKRHSTILLPMGLKFKQTGINPKDMEFLDLRRMNREEILSACGVPPVKVGLLEHAKYDNYRLQEEAFYRDTLMPKMKKIASGLTCDLLPEFKGTEDMEFEFDFAEALAEDASKKADRLVGLFAVGAVTSNQIISTLGLGKGYPGGEQYYMSSLYMPVGGEGVPDRKAEYEQALGQLKAEIKKALKAREET